MQDINFKEEQLIWDLLNVHLEQRLEMQRIVVSSVDENLRPQLRTMILRSLDAKAKCLYFFTDSRSPKIEQWQNNRFSQVLAYSHAELLQLRFTAKVEILQNGPLFESAKRGLKEHQFGDYSSPLPPGSNYNWAKSNPDEKLNFALVKMKIEQMEVLQLQTNAEEHLRYHYDYDPNPNPIKIKRLVP
tara:strand:- start:1159 stop:1719 length:561 start_codon:yes stop_codon:yes gene_type:complete